MLKDKLLEIQEAIRPYEKLSKQEIYTGLVKEKLAVNLKNYEIEMAELGNMKNLTELAYSRFMANGWKHAVNYVTKKLSRISVMEWQKPQKEDEEID